MMFSSGRFALPVYMGALHDTQSGRIKIGYDYQRVIMKRSHVEAYQQMLEQMLAFLAENPQAKISDLPAGNP